ncbi:CPSF A subunit region-domain-containing protein [Pseudomassariella vexata]|uniref:Protein CFT1 n=1 Tax=Pseudomassariella vexata TaxID=1141098 RepID=A0A1Y2EAR9_9PEZI|nr:CPSF A subunit region-domain-containing protein [Pseudomassariella vexata]ORY68642.1 CPSF A subunit region-domain-containing protein [Pseudomassariella vexata]
MQCYTELTPPTAVTHSLALPFTSAQSNNLVVARASLLQIFTKSVSAEFDNARNPQNVQSQSSKLTGHYDSRINDDDGLEASFLGGDAMIIRSDRSSYTKLVLVAEYPLSGTVTGLARVKLPTCKSGGEALLLAFKDAKLSLVEWDPQKHTIYTTVVHYYEQDELQRVPWAAPLSSYVNFLAADPGSRCAALRFGARNLAILQFSHNDEDIEMDDWDEELDGPRPVKEMSTTLVNGTSSSEDTPYSSSFVLRLSNLDPSLIHPVHLAFLHEYREPTFGILSSTMAPSASLGRKDHLSYMVFTLDLKQKASTTILSVGGLPQDLWRVIALPAPVGGALLVGTNELIHVDQSGKSHGVGVNTFARHTTSFGLVDQSDLDLRLEGCDIEVLSAENGELLMVLNDGRLALISFRIDGRTVAGLSIRLVLPEAGGSIVDTCVSTLSRLGKGCLFAGSEDGDSLVIGWTRKHSHVSKKKRSTQDDSLDLDTDDEDFDDMDDDDLYADDSALVPQALAATHNAGVKTGDLVFRVHDKLVTLAPIKDIAIGQNVIPSDEDPTSSKMVASDLSLVCAVGRGNAGSVAIINREIQPRVIGHFEFPEARGFWTIAAQKPVPKALQGDKGASIDAEYATSVQRDTFMIVSKIDLDGYETSDVYALTGAGFEALTGTEFEPAAGFTVEAGTMGSSHRIIQVLKAEVRSYDGNFGLSQILPMLDEETGAEPRVVSASIADPFLLLVRDDSSICVAKMDKNLELEELDKDHVGLVTTRWLTGCLYEDTTSIFTDVQTDKGSKPGENIVMFLLSGTGALYVYALPDLTQPVCVVEGLSYVPPILSAGYSARRGSAKEALTEILVADLGDTTSSSPFLIVRHANDDLTIYEPFRITSEASTELSKSLHFQKITNARLAKSPVEVADDEAEQQPRNVPLRRCADVGGFKTVFLPGASPSFIMKSSKTLPKVIGLQGGGVRTMSPFHTEGCERGFIYADSYGIARVSQIPTDDTSYAEIGMSLKKVPLGADINSIAYHTPSTTWVVGCDTLESFELPKEDDYHKEWQAEKDLTFKPRVERGLIKLINPSNWTVVDEVELESCETVMCVETLNLEISESTNERKQLIVVGTAVSRGEDLPIRGHIFVYDVVEVIPKPGRPETNKRLKLVAKEDIPRGAVTALSEIGSQGLMLVAQGQKCMVRGLKEDGSLLPVAFMDMSCYVTSVRELKGTGLCLMADAVKGVWFAGYTEEPYKMILLGKSSTTLEVLTADFLPDGNELSIVASDSDGNILVLQFDPDHPKSLGGHLLLHRTTFSAGAHIPTKSLLLPRTLPPGHELLANQAAVNGKDANEDEDPPPQPQTLLLASPTGLLATMIPLSEQEYRRLSSLASQLSTSLTHFAGLNPKAYRAPASTGSVGRQPPVVDAGIGRNVVDGALLARWNELGAGRKAEIAGRVGFSGVDEVRATLESILGAAGLGYL